MPEAFAGMQGSDEPRVTGFRLDEGNGFRYVEHVESRCDDMIRLLPAMLCLLVTAGCAGTGQPAAPIEESYRDDWVAITTVPLPHGVASGDPTSRAARIWFRTSGPAQVELEWVPVGQDRDRSRAVFVYTSQDHDYAATVAVENLQPATRYRYTVRARRTDQQSSREVIEESGSGTFTTPSADDKSQPLTFLWSGDLGGQKQCRDEWVGYPIFYRMLQVKPDFAILLGDTVYGDDVCPSPPNAPGGEAAAATLDQFRAKHRYQRGSAAVQRFLASVPVYAIWDDHEVRNNFSGSYDPLMPAGRQAFLEYWPIGTPPEDPRRLYRKFRRGADAEFFILDTRQYRDKNADPDGPTKTMLGPAQREWLTEDLTRSTATWKFIVTSVPLSNPKDGTAQTPGNDSWARAADGTGFQTELRTIVSAILKGRVRNVIWLAADVHYTQVNAYDPNGDGTTDFHEFIAGPLSAAPNKPVPPDSPFKPTTLHSEGGFYNFGVVTVNRGELRLEIVDDAGLPRFTRTFRAQ
jgi:alkaline phosphatase D